MPQSETAFDSVRLAQLIAERCNGTLSTSDQSELERIVEASAAARDTYWEFLSIHAALCWMHSGKAECDARLADFDSADPRPTSPAASPGRRTALLAWLPLASIAIAASLWGLVWFAPWRSAESPGLTRVVPRSLASLDQAPVGKLSPLSGDGRWSFGIPGEKNRQELRSGDTLWLDRGAAELRLTNGIVAQLEAPLILKMVSSDFARLLRGRITVDVPESAEGFTVETAAAEVIDLGTTFSVDVADTGDTDVIVFQGKVDVNLALPEHAPPAAAKSTTRLHTGEAVRVAENGTLSRIMNVRRTDFSANRASPPVIQEVRDNVVRDQTMKYYEIVAGGMQEDVLAFVDRNYQWNGVDDQGIPSFLLGGDYVKTFNDDKVNPNQRIMVTIERPAMLYLLVDDRLETTDWLDGQFEDTGENIGIDEGYNFPNDTRSVAFGAGVSIDQVHSIWRRRVSAPETITIGPYGLVSHQDSQRGRKAKLNMYGIVAVPLDRDE